MPSEDKTRARLYSHVPLVAIVVTRPLAGPSRFGVAGIAYCNFTLAVGVFLSVHSDHLHIHLLAWMTCRRNDRRVNHTAGFDQFPLSGKLTVHLVQKLLQKLLFG